MGNPTLIIPFICPFSFPPIKFFITYLSVPMKAGVFKFCIHLQRVEVYWVKENHNAEIYFAFFYVSSLTPMLCTEKFVSKIFQELLHLEFWNLVQTLGTTPCIVYERFSFCMLIFLFICPFSFFSNISLDFTEQLNLLAKFKNSTIRFRDCGMRGFIFWCIIFYRKNTVT